MMMSYELQNLEAWNKKKMPTEQHQYVNEYTS